MAPSKIVHAKILWPNNWTDFTSWQQKQSKKLSPYVCFVSSAEEYHRYINRHSSSLGGMTLSINSLASLFRCAVPERKKHKCGDELRPGTTSDLYCAVCKVEHSVEFLYVITQKWEEIGGPFRPDPESPTTTPAYSHLRKGWRGARLELLALATKLEHQAKIERRLNAYLPSSPHDHNKPVYDAKTALERYHEIYKYPLADFSLKKGHEEAFESRPMDPPKQKKSVHFSDNTSNGSGRENCTFRRSHSLYRAGRHAAPYGVEYEDTTLNHDVKFILQQCKVFFTTNTDFRRYSERPRHWLAFDCVAGDHPRWKGIIEGMEPFLQRMRESKRLEWVKMLQGGADGVAIVVDGYEIVDYVPLKAPREKEKVVRWKAGWISL